MVFRALRRPRIYFGDAQKPWFLRGVGLEGGEKIGKYMRLEGVST